MISHSQAIIDPRAMMIHFKNTFIANRAMMCSQRFAFQTFFTLGLGESFRVSWLSQNAFGVVVDKTVKNRKTKNCCRDCEEV
jgi:adenine-specific DNA methylase